MAYFGLLPPTPHPRGAEVYRHPFASRHPDNSCWKFVPPLIANARCELTLQDGVLLLDETPRFMVRQPGLTRRRRSYGSETLCQDEFSGTGDIIE